MFTGAELKNKTMHARAATLPVSAALSRLVRLVCHTTRNMLHEQVVCDSPQAGYHVLLAL